MDSFELLHLKYFMKLFTDNEFNKSRKNEKKYLLTIPCLAAGRRNKQSMIRYNQFSG